MVGGFISLLWCLVALVLSMTRIAPKTSMFPEIDFASKVTRHQAPDLVLSRNSGSSDALANVLSRLRNANSHEIRKGLAGSEFHVGVAETEVEDEGNRFVTLIPEDTGGSSLSHRDDVDDVWAGSRRGAMLQRFSRTSYHE